MVQGVSNLQPNQIPPIAIGGGSASGSVIVHRTSQVEVFRAGGARGLSALEVLIASGQLDPDADADAYAQYLRQPAIAAAQEANEATEESRQATAEANTAIETIQALVSDEAQIREDINTAAQQVQTSKQDVTDAATQVLEAKDAVIAARDVSVGAKQAAESARDQAVTAAETFDRLLVTAQRAQTVYGENDFSRAFLFARQGVELLFTQGFYRFGLIY